MRNLDIADSRAMLKFYAAQPLDQGQVLVENGTFFGELPAGGATRIEDNPSCRQRRAASARRRRHGVRNRLMSEKVDGMTSPEITAAVAGASGYVGGEVLRTLIAIRR